MEEEVIDEILQYNYDRADVQHMRDAENIDLCLYVNWLNQNCVKGTEPQWFQFGIHKLIANGKANLRTVGINRPQFCKYCGEEIYSSKDHNVRPSKHAKRLKT